MRFAFVLDDKVELIKDMEDGNEAAALARQYQALIDVTGASPAPQVGWILVNGQVIDPTGLAQPDRHISKEKFLSRLTDDEICTIEDFAKGTSQYARAVRAAMKRQEQSTYIDLNYWRTIQGIQNMVALGLLTPDRANTILNAPITEEEKFKG